MPRYKDYSYDQHKLLPIAFREQILPGTFEYTLNYLIDHEVDLSVFETRYRNEETGAPVDTRSRPAALTNPRRKGITSRYPTRFRAGGCG